MFQKAASGTGAAQLMMAHEIELWEALYSPDGEWLIARTGGQDWRAGGRDVWAIQPGVDTVPVPIIVTDFDEKAIALSPDGRWFPARAAGSPDLPDTPVAAVRGLAAPYAAGVLANCSSCSRA